MKLRAFVSTSDGKPVTRGSVEIVGPEGRGIASVGRGEIVDGNLEAAAEPGPIWGVLIDKQPIVTFPARVEGDLVDLGRITLLGSAVSMPAFHAPDGQVFALPGAEGVSVSPRPEQPTRVPTATPGLTFGDLVGRSAQQLGASLTERASVQLTGASVRVRGVPTVRADAIALDFPDPVLAATGAGLSELSFTLQPRVVAAAAPPNVPAGPSTPNLVGYSRELATRKLAALGLVSDFNTVIVSSAADAGRVVRQIPAAGTSVAAGALVRLFIGKIGAA